MVTFSPSSSVTDAGAATTGQSSVFRSQQAETQAFLHLLVIQLQHQDPLEPLRNEDFLAQLAQFQSLEQQIIMTQQNDAILLSSTLASASSLIGRMVTVTGAEGNEAGIVESVVVRDGVANVIVNGEEFGLSEIVQVHIF